MGLLSIGYETYSLPAFIDRLRAEGVSTLFDIRQIANSRRAGFSKQILNASLVDAGIAYRHMRALGTPKPGRDAAKRGDRATLKAIYAQVLDQPEAGLDLKEIAEQARTGTICLMCLEEDWTTCHRAMVCERLATAFGVQATHL